jgi:hypothetical protein
MYHLVHATARRDTSCLPGDTAFELRRILTAWKEEVWETPPNAAADCWGLTHTHGYC